MSRCITTRSTRRCRTRSHDATTKSLALTITVQGCHEVDPKICYPPHPTQLTLDVAAGVAAEARPMLTRPLAGSGETAPQPRRRPSARRKCRRTAAARAGVRVRGDRGESDQRPGALDDARAITCIATRVPYTRRRRGRQARQAKLAAKARITPTSISARSRVLRPGRAADSARARERRAADDQAHRRISGLSRKRHLLSGDDETVSVAMPVATAAELRRERCIEPRPLNQC